MRDHNNKLHGKIYISLTKKTSGSRRTSAPGFLCGGYDLQCLLLAQLSGEVFVAGLGGLGCPVVELGGGQALVGGLVEIAGALVAFVHALAGTVKLLDDLVAAGVVPVLEAGADVLAGLLVADDTVTVEGLPFRLRHEKSAAAPAKLHGGLALDEVQEKEAIVGRWRAEVVAVGEPSVFAHQHGLNKLRLAERLVFFLEVQSDAVVQVAEQLDGEILEENDLLQRRNHRTSCV